MDRIERAFVQLIICDLLSQQLVNRFNRLKFKVLKQSAIRIFLHYLMRYLEPLFGTQWNPNGLFHMFT